MLLHSINDNNNTDRPDVRDRIRREWETESRQAHEKLYTELDDIRRKWAEEVAQHKQEEDYRHQQALEKLSKEINDTRAKWKEELEHHERDEEQRRRADLSWKDLTPKQECIRYDMREYTAQLVNAPRGEDGLRWCRDKSIVIHGKTYPKAEYCSEQVSRSFTWSSPLIFEVRSYIWTLDCLG